MAMNFEISAAQTNRLFTHCLEQLEAHPRWSASPQLSHVQNMLMAYLRMDKIAEEEGFAALIAQGWGETVLDGALAETLAQWGIDVLPKILRQAAVHYRELRAQIEAQANATPDELREAFPQFSPLDEEYFIECEEIFPQVYTYVRAHYDDFAALLDFQAG